MKKRRRFDLAQAKVAKEEVGRLNKLYWIWSKTIEENCKETVGRCWANETFCLLMETVVSFKEEIDVVSIKLRETDVVPIRSTF